MALKGKKLNNVVMFGEPLNARAKSALEKSSPTADQIIQSLPPSAFLPIPEDTKEEIELQKKISKAEIEKQKVINAEEAKKNRLQKKRDAALKKRRERQKKKERVKKPVVEKSVVEQEPTIIKEIIENKQTNPPEETLKMNLDDELKALEDKIQPKQPEPRVEVLEDNVAEVSGQTDLKDQILDLLEGEESAPSVELISEWKRVYGKNGIHVMAFGEGDVYIYHHLTRGEWKKIKELMSKLRESSNPEEVEEKLKEKVVLYCIVWPSVDENWLDYCKAGILDSLYQMILLNSGFLTPQQAMLLTTQL
tara:strand:- start:13882 stop:14802 length:921 start_codon:yes stop_codon:yes gene_type:complete